MLVVYMVGRVGSRHFFRACMIVVSLLDNVIFIGLCQSKENGRLLSLSLRMSLNVEYVEYVSMILILLHELLRIGI